uniref:Expressed protein n=1 Tax=Oryza sativa subsp. japonica TaxID=39947 RepID=Q10RZ8_ORYSJ|nr:expressed protein [Oryza sativa Japonica Group]ABF93898.1 expressed protein [Oryza sativa Japonica Group]
MLSSFIISSYCDIKTKPSLARNRANKATKIPGGDTGTHPHSTNTILEGRVRGGEWWWCEREGDGHSQSSPAAAAPRRRRRRSPVAAGVLRRPVRARLQGLLQPELPRRRGAPHSRRALLLALGPVRLRQVLQDLVVILGFLHLRLRPLPVPRGPLRLRLRRLRLPRHVILVRGLRRLRRRPCPAHRLPRALRDIRVPPGVRDPDAVQDLRHRRRRRDRLRDAPRHRLRADGGQRRRGKRRVLRHQLPAGVRHGAVRGRPLLGGLRPVRHPGRPARRGRVRGRAIRPGVPREVLH